MESVFVDLLSICGKSKELLGSSREQLFKAAFLHLVRFSHEIIQKSSE